VERTTIPKDPSAAVLPGDGASEATSRAAEIGQRAAAAIDSKRESVARGMDSAAESLHGRADRLPGGEKVAGAAHTAADAVERAADYVRDQDVSAMLADVRDAVTLREVVSGRQPVPSAADDEDFVGALRLGVPPQRRRVVRGSRLG
jgi:DNA segregation ATPase FtsK/SpoIIIE-like protein